MEPSPLVRPRSFVIRGRKTEAQQRAIDELWPVFGVDFAGARLEVYDLNAPLDPSMLYPLLETVMLPDSPNGPGPSHPRITMASSLDDRAVFISGDSKLLIVPVN